MLASLTGLYELTLHLTGKPDLMPGAQDRWAPLLEALIPIKAAKKFDVFLPWSEGQCARASECGYPFRLVWKVEAEN